jgi:hypothetical protein
MGSKGRYLKKCPKPRRLIRSRETWTKYMQLTLFSQRKLALTARSAGHFLRYKTIIKSLQHLKNLKKWPRPLFRPRTNHTCHQKPNPSCETVPLYEIKYLKREGHIRLLRLIGDRVGETIKSQQKTLSS